MYTLKKTKKYCDLDYYLPLKEIDPCCFPPFFLNHLNHFLMP